MAGSRSATSFTGIGVEGKLTDAAPASIDRRKEAKYGAVFGLNRTATRASLGAISFKISIHFPPIENSKAVNPVIFPPGRAKLDTKPWPTGSDTDTNTIGTVLVASLNAA